MCVYYYLDYCYVTMDILISRDKERREHGGTKAAAAAGEMQCAGLILYYLFSQSFHTMLVNA